MPLASELPDIKITDEDRTALAQYLFDEITNCESSRQDLVNLWIDIQKTYEQVSIPEKKDFPFENAAHLMIPVTATYVEQIHARIMNTLYAPEDPFTVKPTQEELYKYAKSIKKWLTWAIQNELDLERVDYSLILELLKLGNMVAKIIYTKETKTLYDYDQALDKYNPNVVITKDNPEVLHISINDFLFPTSARSLEEANWKAHRLHVKWHAMKERAFTGRYIEEAVKKISTWYISIKDEYDTNRDKLADNDPGTFAEFELFEVWFKYPLKRIPTGDMEQTTLPISDLDMINNFDKDVDLVAVFHKDSRTLLRLQYNWYPRGMDPFEHECYVGRENQILGIGVGQMARPFQLEVSTMHNQRLDNATVSNTVSYIYKSGSTIPSTLRLKPGGGIPADDPNDIKPFQMGQKYDSTINEERHTLGFLQERIGARDLEMDQANLSRTPATTTLAMMQEKGRRLDNVIRTIRRFKRKVMLKSVLLYQAHYPKERLIKVLGPEHGSLVVEFLENVSPDDIWDGMGIEVTATTSTTSKELDRQSKVQLFSLLVQYYGQLGQYVTAALQAPPNVQPLFLEIVEGLSTFVREILDDFNIRNKADFIVNLESVTGAAQQAATPGTPGAVQGDPMAALPPALLQQIAQSQGAIAQRQ